MKTSYDRCTFACTRCVFNRINERVLERIEQELSYRELYKLLKTGEIKCQYEHNVKSTAQYTKPSIHDGPRP